MEKRRESWIDCVKGMGILAVVFSHLVTILYHNRGLSNLSVFSVSVLVFMAGYNAFGSARRRGFPAYGLPAVLKGVGRLLGPYAVATLVATVLFEGGLSVASYLRHLLLFNVVAPYYFIAFFVQLMLVAPLLCGLAARLAAARHRAVWAPLSLAGITLVAVLAVRYTHFFEIGGAQHLLGGTFLIVYYLGILLAAFGLEKVKSPVPTVVCLAVVPLFGWFIYHWQELFDLWPMLGNPPGFTVLLYSVAVCWLFIRLFRFLQGLSGRAGRVAAAVCGPLAACGRHSMAVFTWHVLCIGTVVPLVNRLLAAIFVGGAPGWAAAAGGVGAYVLILAVPVLGAMLWHRGKAAAKRLAARQG